MTVRPWSREGQPGETATVAGLGPGRGRQKVTRGTGMVTPRETLVHSENGRTEELIPGRHRFARSYPLVCQHPEWFRPCDPEDTDTFHHHRELTERKRRHLGGTTRASTSSSRKRFQLNPDRLPRVGTDAWQLNPDRLPRAPFRLP
jgi:hypothetical protein